MTFLVSVTRLADERNITETPYLDFRKKKKN